MSKHSVSTNSAAMRPLQRIGLILAFIILAGMFIFPVSEALPYAARNTLGVLLAVIVLLVTEALPIGMVCIAAVPALFVFGCVPSLPAALSGYTNPILFFVLASFGISEAITRVPLSKRMLIGLMNRFGRSSNMLLLAIMTCVALLSAVISNVAAAVVFIPIVLGFLDLYENEDEKKRTSKAFMIALPVASMIGGMMTPAGSSINMLAISMLEKNANITIPFVNWMLFGVPIALVMLPAAWLICIKVFKPAKIAESKIKGFINSVELDKKLSWKEKFVLLVVVAIVILWILSSWVPALNITVVAVFGLLLFFIPGKEILTWKTFTESVAWEAYFLIATMISMGAAITSSGLGAWIASVIFPSSLAGGTPIVIAFVALLTFVLLIPIPVAPALITMLSAPLIAFAGNIGVSPVLLVLTLGLCAANCYLLPLDTVPLMTFSTGRYKMFDMPKATVWIQLLMIVVVAVWLTVGGKLLGLA